MKEGERDGHPTDPDRLVDGRSAADAPASTARREHQDS
jgi:hypothetical protein